MMRLLAAVLATVGFLSMAAAGHATGSAMGGGPVAHGGTTTPSMADTSQARCQGGNSCLLLCATCFPAPRGQADNALLAKSKTTNSLDRLAGFDLSWLLYRPPKAG